MIKPEVVAPDEEVDLIGHVFEAPLVSKGWTWLPLTQLFTWAIMVREAGRKHPEWDWPTRLEVGGYTMGAILGSEWCHNLAHAAVSKWLGKPVDCIRVTWGMPLLVYFDTEDPDVTPRQHIIRSLGGPAINAIFLGIAILLKPVTHPNSKAREFIDTLIGMNIFLTSGGMLPIPYIDGGTALKWTLVEKGHTSQEADETLKKVNAVTAVGLGVSAAAAFKKKQRFLGGIFAMFAATSLLIATNLLNENDSRR